MHTTFKRGLALLLTLLMLLSVLPMSVFASDTDGSVTVWFYCENPNEIKLEEKKNPSGKITGFNVSVDRVKAIPLRQVTVTAEDVAKINAKMKRPEDQGNAVTAAHILIKACEDLKKPDAFLTWDDSGKLTQIDGVSTGSPEVKSGQAQTGAKKWTIVCGSKLLAVVGTTPAISAISADLWKTEVRSSDQIIRLTKFFSKNISARNNNPETIQSEQDKVDETASGSAFFVDQTLSDSEFTHELKQNDGEKTFQLKLQRYAIATQKPTGVVKNSLVNNKLSVYEISEDGNAVLISSDKESKISFDTTQKDPTNAKNSLFYITVDTTLPAGDYPVTTAFIATMLNAGLNPVDPLIIRIKGVGVDLTDYTTALAETPDPETDNLYLHEGDRYSGGGYAGADGSWWSEYVRVRNEVKAGSYTTTEAANAAADRLWEAAKKLIAKDKVNATALYETIHSTDELRKSLYMPDMWANMITQRKASQAMLNSLYREDGTPATINEATYQQTVDTQRAALQTAIDALDKKAVNDADKHHYPITDVKIAWRAIDVFLRYLYNPSNLKETDYTPESWAKYQAAYRAAKPYQDQVPGEVIGEKQVSA